jgi:hypothetical protein
MGKWLEKLKNKNPTNKAPTKPTKHPFVGFVGAFPLENQKFMGRDRRLEKEIESASSQIEQSRNNVNPTVDEPTKPTKGSVIPINVFKRTPLPDGMIVCLSCLDHPHCWVAHRTGTNTPKGHGKGQLEAIMALEVLEKQFRS